MTSIMTKLRKLTTCSYARYRWGAVQLENDVPTKRIDIKLAENKPTLTLYWMLLKVRNTNGHSCVYTPLFFQCLKQIRITQLLTDSNPSSHREAGKKIDVDNNIISFTKLARRD